MQNQQAGTTNSREFGYQLTQSGITENPPRCPPQSPRIPAASIVAEFARIRMVASSIRIPTNAASNLQPIENCVGLR